MPMFLKRTLVAAAFLTPLGLLAGGAVTQTRASSDLQYHVGTDGEYCKEDCYGKTYICCSI